MRRLFTLFMALCVMASTSFASGLAVIQPAKKASDVFIPVGKTGSSISLQQLSEIKLTEFEALTGSKMKLADKVSFKLAQRELKKSIAPDGTIKSKKLSKLVNRVEGEGGGFHLGGFALGFLVGLIGVLIAYLINDEKKKSRVKWAWIGWGVYVVLAVALILGTM